MISFALKRIPVTKNFRLPILLSLCVLAYSQQKPNPNFTGGEVKTITEEFRRQAGALLLQSRRAHEMAQP